MIKGCCSRNNIVEFHESETEHIGVQFGMGRDDTSLSDYVSSSGKYQNPGDTAVTCMDWMSLFEIMHRIALGNTEHIQVEAISIMNFILMRSNPHFEREKFGLPLLFESIARLLKKEAGLSVQKQAVRLLFLLLNCPKLLMMFCSCCKESGENKVVPVFQGYSCILEGLVECVTCSGNGTQELKLRRQAIIVLAFVASCGKSGIEVLLSPGISKRIDLLQLIVQVLASELEAEAAASDEPPEICKERNSLIREALILLNRLASNPLYSSTVLGVLTSSRDMTSLTIDVANKMSRKGRGRRKPGSTKKTQMEAEIVDLAHLFRTRVFAFLGDIIS